jgi:hypothetical protein
LSGAATTAGTVTTAAQPNITSVGTLTSLGVNGTATAVAFTANTGVFTGNGNGLSSIVGANVTGTVSSATTAGTVTTAAQPNITSVGTLTSLNSSGTITAPAFTANTGVFTGNGSALTALNGSNITTGTVAAARVATLNQNTTGSAATVTTNAQPNITSVGTLSSLFTSGDVGIGTTTVTPIWGRTLQVGDGSGASSISLIGTGAGTNGDGYIACPGGTEFQLIARGGTALVFGSNDAERMRILSGGNVGIGTSSPAEKLDVVGNIELSGAANRRLSFYSSTNWRYNFATTGDNFSLYDADNTNFLELFYSGTLANKRASVLNALHVLKGGNVGIGTTAPNSSMQLSYSNPASVPAAGAGGHAIAAGAAGYGFATGVLTNGTTYIQSTRWDGTAINYDLSLQPNGSNVGIGKTNPTATLDVNGNISASSVTASGYHIRSVNTGISAAGSTQGTATALTKEINVVSTVASGAGVVFPTAVAGMVISITNTSANALLVYPATGAAINSAAVNAAYSQPAGSTLQFIAPTTTQWYTVGATFA